MTTSRASLGAAITCAVMLTYVPIARAYQIDANTSPGKNSVFVEKLDSPSPVGGYSASGTIAKGRTKAVLRVDVTYINEDSVGGGCASQPSLVGILVLVNGLGMNGFARQNCDSSAYDCQANGTFWLDLDAAEAQQPGQFKGQPLNITAQGSDYNIGIGSCNVLHGLTFSAEVVKK